LSATSLKDENWSTYTRKYGFQSQGIFQGVDHTDINTICRFITTEDKENPKGILAVGYDDQSIRLFSYPTYIKNQVHKQYFGHSSHVTKIKFIEGDQRMVSIGGLDRTVIVWKIDGMVAEKPKKKKNKDEDDDDDDGLDDLDEDVDVPARVFKKKPKPIVEEDFT
jgi:WD40 repeat protein